MKGGALNLNKPAGWSSFEVVKRVRSILKEKRVGHCGTLDPMATGVLVVVYGTGTSRSSELMGQDKTYLAEMRLGVKTDTGDLTGKILQTQIPPIVEEKVLEKIFEKFTGTIEQVPPMFSAIKRNGMKLYEYARRGIEVVRPPRSIEIYSLELVKMQPGLIQFRAHCSKGTYIRTLAEDLGEALGVPSALSSLVREKSGSFSLEQSLTWDRVVRMDREELLKHTLEECQGLTPNLPLS